MSSQSNYSILNTTRASAQLAIEDTLPPPYSDIEGDSDGEVVDVANLLSLMAVHNVGDQQGEFIGDVLTTNEMLTACIRVLKNEDNPENEFQLMELIHWKKKYIEAVNIEELLASARDNLDSLGMTTPSHFLSATVLSLGEAAFTGDIDDYDDFYQGLEKVKAILMAIKKLAKLVQAGMTAEDVKTQAHQVASDTYTRLGFPPIFRGTAKF
eukprot:m.351584 g.351584  ORF g.351584 m.351584 type:complete len:211 (+) comp16287_c0_seq1:34-666(+)